MQSVSILAVIALACSCALAIDVTLNDHWKLWKEYHKKRYSDTEELHRYVILIDIQRFRLNYIK